MAQLKDSEKRLLGLFGLLAIVLGGFYGFKKYKSQMLNYERDRIALSQEKENLLTKKLVHDEMLSKRAWVDGRLRAYKNEEQKLNSLVTFLQNQASTFGLDLEKPEIVETDEIGLNSFYDESVVDAQVTGTFNDVMDWIYSLQTPGEFREIQTFNLLPKKARIGRKDEGEPEVTCRLRVAQWWHPESRNIAANPEAYQSASAAPTVQPVPAPSSPAPAPAEGEGESQTTAVKKPISRLAPMEKKDPPPAPGKTAIEKPRRGVVLPPKPRVQLPGPKKGGAPNPQ